MLSARTPAVHAPEAARPSEALRLVRLRVGLAMLAMAVLPIVLVILILPVLAGPDRGARSQLAASSGDVSAALAADLGRIRSALLITAADPQVASLLDGKGAPSTALKASLTSTAGVLGASVPSASLVDRSGRERLLVVHGRAVAPQADPSGDALLTAVGTMAPGSVYRGTSQTTASGGTTLVLAAPVRASSSGPVLGLVRFDLSLDRLLAADGAAATAAGGYAMIVNRQTGSVIVDGRAGRSLGSSGATPASGGALPDVGGLFGSALARAGQAWATLFGDGWGVGVAPVSVAVPGFAGWTVVVAQPVPTSGVPLQLILAALALMAAIAALAIWMARQVIHPAAELEESRHELASLYEVARRDALIDPLTGLGNHRAFQEALGRELEQARRHRYPVTLVLLDLDDFKQVNDRAGHASGDAVLSAFGLLLTGGVRRGDGAFRVGGDEFAVVMPRSDAEEGAIVARRLLGVSLEPGAGSGPRRPPISFSAGIASAPDHGTVAGELSARADAALYWGKRHGRTTVEIYDPARHRAELPGLVEDAAVAIGALIERRLLRPAFQPIVRLSDGAILGYEGLVRPLPESGFSTAAHLFEAAAAAGRTVDLDRQCIETVAAAAGRLPEGRFLCLNLSPLSLEAPDFSPGAIRAVLARFGLTPDRVVLEVTEREAVEALDRLKANLAACRAAGFRIAADDVGAGNAGLRLLSTVPFDMVKIDLALVHEGALHDPALSVLRSLVEMAGSWGALIVAEGIENGDQLRAMRNLRVVAGQGYLLGRPGDDPSAVETVDLGSLQHQGVWPPAQTFRPWRVGSGPALTGMSPASTPRAGT